MGHGKQAAGFNSNIQVDQTEVLTLHLDDRVGTGDSFTDFGLLCCDYTMAKIYGNN